jgi:hypothetical protein
MPRSHFPWLAKMILTPSAEMAEVTGLISQPKEQSSKKIAKKLRPMFSLFILVSFLIEVF